MPFPFVDTRTLDTVIEIENNAVADQTTETEKNFDKLRRLSEKIRFAIIVLSEREGYKYTIKEEELGYPVFTLLSRHIATGRLTWSTEQTL